MIDEDQVGNKYVFIIDTDEYSGNFERSMCGYITGHVGECGVGREGAKAFYEDYPNDPFEDYVACVSDDHGCCRPTSIWSTKGMFSDGNGLEYKEGEEDLALQKNVNNIRTKAYSDLVEIVNATEDLNSARESMEELMEAVEEAKNLKELPKYPAYCSVAIFFSSKPTDEQINIMKARAKEFAKDIYKHSRMRNFHKPTAIEVTGFRLIKVKTEQEEENIDF